MSNSILAKMAVEISANNTLFNKRLSDSQKRLSSFTGAVGKIGAAFGVGLGLSALKGLGDEIVNTAAKYQKFGAVLQNALGSRSAAQNAFSEIQDFAAKTPFQVDEITAAFIKLTNQGFKPTKDQLTSLGDLAASQGKTFDQLTEAILDAQTGENERLKEFGVRAKKSGDDVTYTFKGVSTTVKNSAAAIREYILSLGQAQGVSGSMAAVSATLGGKISNFNDNLDRLMATLGDQSSGVVGGFYDLANNVLGSVNESLNDQVKALSNENIGLNILVDAITNVNTSEEARKLLITELNQKYPDFLKNLDAEKVTNEQLSSRLKDVNDQFVRKIALQASEKRLAGVQEEILDLIDEEIEQRKLIEKIRKGEITYHDDLKEGMSAEQKIARDIADAEHSIYLVQEQRKQIQKDLTSTIKDYDNALGLFNKTNNDYFRTTTANVTATNNLASALDNLHSKIKFKNSPKGSPIELPKDAFIRTDIDLTGENNKLLTDKEQTDPVPGIVAEREAYDGLIPTLEELAEAREKDAAAMRKSGEVAKSMGTMIGDAFGEAASGQKTWSDALKSLLPQVLKLLITEALASTITAGAKTGAKAGNPIVGIIAAAAGVAAISAMFGKAISTGGAGGGYSAATGNNYNRFNANTSVQDSAPQLVTVLKGEDMWIMLQNYQSGKRYTSG